MGRRIIAAGRLPQDARAHQVVCRTCQLAGDEHPARVAEYLAGVHNHLHHRGEKTPPAEVLPVLVGAAHTGAVAA